MGKEKTLMAKGSWLLLHFHTAVVDKADSPTDVRNMKGFKVKVKSKQIFVVIIQKKENYICLCTRSHYLLVCIIGCTPVNSVYTEFVLLSCTQTINNYEVNWLSCLLTY